MYFSPQIIDCVNLCLVDRHLVLNVLGDDVPIRIGTKSSFCTSGIPTCDLGFFVTGIDTVQSFFFNQLTDDFPPGLVGETEITKEGGLNIGFPVEGWLMGGPRALDFGIVLDKHPIGIISKENEQ